MKVNGNGLVEIYGEKTQERGFFDEVVSLPKYRSRTGNGSLAELWEQRFNEARS